MSYQGRAANEHLPKHKRNMRLRLLSVCALVLFIATPAGDGFIAGQAPLVVYFLNKKHMTPYAKLYYRPEFQRAMNM